MSRRHVVLFCFVLLAACAPQLKVPPPEQQLFLLEAQCPPSIDGPPLESGILAVRPMTVSPGYSTRHLIYRRGPSRFETDYYNLFLARPEQLATQCILRCINESRLFGQTIQAGSVLTPDYALEGSLSAIYADFHKGGNAVLKTQFFLLQKKDLDMIPVWQGRYDITAPISGSNPSDVVAGMNSALEKTLIRLVDDIREYLERRPKN